MPVITTRTFCVGDSVEYIDDESGDYRSGTVGSVNDDHAEVVDDETGHPEDGESTAPYGPDDVRRAKGEAMDVSERRVCVILSVPRSAVRESVRGAAPRTLQVHDVLAARVERLIEQPPPATAPPSA